jgi:hypothetical protein
MHRGHLVAMVALVGPTHPTDAVPAPYRTCNNHHVAKLQVSERGSWCPHIRSPWPNRISVVTSMACIQVSYRFDPHSPHTVGCDLYQVVHRLLGFAIIQGDVCVDMFILVHPEACMLLHADMSCLLGTFLLHASCIVTC